MYIPDDVICKDCQGVFCCVDCRRKHEIKNHAIPVRKSTKIDNLTANQTAEHNLKSGSLYETKYLFCPICENCPLPLQAEMPIEILLHIESNHLPLRCKKCLKIYNSINDLKEFTKCFQRTAVCLKQESVISNQFSYTNEVSKVTVNKATIPHTITIVKNSPMCRQDFNESQMTPISIINMRWKAKSKLTNEEIISDSVSSIKNISSISNSSIRHTMGTASAAKGKVIRCSSTPVHFEMVLSKPKEQTFNASGGGHISSIQYNSGCESDISPALLQPNSLALEPVNRYIKNPGARSKITTVTPLRQVMSKSIQKAFAEHGLPSSSTGIRSSNVCQRKKIFDSASSPDNDIAESPQPPALDLRLSPAIRRSQSESEEPVQYIVPSNITQKINQKDLPNLRRKILLSAQKFSTESIVITRTEQLSTVTSSSSAASSSISINSVKPISSANSLYQLDDSNKSGESVFKSCSSVEIITATTEQVETLESENVETHSALSPFTPITRTSGPIINKKLIEFDTPKIKSNDLQKSVNSPNDIFFTPNASPMCNEDNEMTEINKEKKVLAKQNLCDRFSTLKRPSIKECAHSTAFSRIESISNALNKGDAPTIALANDYEDEVFLPKETENNAKKMSESTKKHEPSQASRLWSLMTSVMRLPIRKEPQSKDFSKKTDSYGPTVANTNSIIKRCASIAGSLVHSKPLVDESEFRSLKRKRTYTTDNQSNSSYRTQFSNSEATAPNFDDMNTSSKRFRIQGRRPIDRMRFNS